MNYVRFHKNSENFPNYEDPDNRRFYWCRRLDFSSFMMGIRRRFSGTSERFNGIKKWSIHSRTPTERPKKGSKMKVHDPQGPFLQTWNKIFVIFCLFAVFIDPLFFYIPVVDTTNWCLSLDNNLQIIASVLRTFVDIFYVYHIVLKFRTGFIAPSSRVFGRGELTEDPKAIAIRYLKTTFIIDVLAILPLPQAVILIVRSVNAPISKITKVWLEIVIFAQYVPRILRIYPLYNEVTRTSGKFTETPWTGAAFNLLLYMLASHLIGAFWYIFAVERLDSCWRIECLNANANGNGTCNSVNNLYCGVAGRGNTSFLQSTCNGTQSDDPTVFNFGIFGDARTARVADNQYFISKFFYCFWWGLRNLTALGQNLVTSEFVWEIVFAISICITGLVLFSLLIGNMQKYLASITTRIEEMRVKRRDAEEWMSHRMLPENLRDRIRRYEQYKWQETRGVEEDCLIQNLPKDLRRDIKRHLCLSLLQKVPMFEKMDEQLLDAMCSFLKPVYYTEASAIVREGDPVDEMLFIMRGDIVTMTTNGGRTGFFNSVSLKAGDFCGDELLTWALDPNSSTSLPISTRTVRATMDVEAFSLTAEDLKFVATQFRRLNSKQIQHTFRFHSEQWRTWGACFIQAAWRRHCKRKFDRSLQEEEDKLQEALRIHSEEAEHKPSLGSTMYASRFASNMLGTLRRNNKHSAKVSPRLPSPGRRLPPLPLQKPFQPDFSVEKH